MSGDGASGGRARLFALLSALRSTARGLPVNLTEAALVGDLASMRAWLERGAALEERTVGFASPLAAACAAGQLDAARLRLVRGAAIEPAGAIITPLHAAIGHGRRDVVAELVARGGRVTTASAGFLAACAAGHTRMLQDVVAAGFDLAARVEGKPIRLLGIEAARSSGRASRVEAFLRGHPSTAEELDAEDATRREELRERAADLARSRGEEPVAPDEDRPALVAEGLRLTAEPGAGAWVDADGESVVGLAARTGVVELMEAALAAGGDPAHRAALTGLTPLHRAAQIGSDALVTRLLARGVDPDPPAAGRTTPLMMAARFGVPEVVAALLAAGASPAARDVNGWTARRHASGPFSDRIVELLSARRGRKDLRP